MHTVGDVLVDGLGVGDVGNIVLRDRQHLAEDGIMIVVLTLEAEADSYLQDRILYREVLSMLRNLQRDLMDEAKRVVNDAMEYCLITTIADWGKIKMK